MNVIEARQDRQYSTEFESNSPFEDLKIDFAMPPNEIRRLYTVLRALPNANYPETLTMTTFAIHL